MEGLNTHVLLTTSSQICTRTSFWYKNIYLFCFGFVLRFGIRIYTVYYLSQKKRKSRYNENKNPAQHPQWHNESVLAHETSINNQKTWTADQLTRDAQTAALNRIPTHLIP